MTHVLRTAVHAYQGRRKVIRTSPIPDRTAADVQSAVFVVDGEVSVDATAEDTDDGLVVSVTLTSEVTSALSLGLHDWQLLVTDALGFHVDPLAVGSLLVSRVASAV